MVSDCDSTTKKPNCGGPAMGSMSFARPQQACSFKRLQTVMGHCSMRINFDLYGHPSDHIEKDRADMPTMEAAIRAA